MHKALVFNIDRLFYIETSRNELPHLTKHEREIIIWDIIQIYHHFVIY